MLHRGRCGKGRRSAGDHPGQDVEEQLDGEQKRFQAGLSENFRVLDRQNQLAQAENTALSTLINYKKSIITLQKAMYILLESSEFEIAKGSSGNVPDLNQVVSARRLKRGECQKKAPVMTQLSSLKCGFGYEGRADGLAGGGIPNLAVRALPEPDRLTRDHCQGVVRQRGADGAGY